MDFAELEANLLLFDDWADRYQYIIGLGAKLPPLDDCSPRNPPSENRG